MWSRVACGVVSMMVLVRPSLAGQAPAPPPQERTTPEPMSRAEWLRQQREAKAGALAPYEPSGLERGMAVAEGRVVPILMRDGLYAKLGSLSTSSGLAYGAGFRDRELFAGSGTIDLWAARSFTGYWALDASGEYPIIGRRRLVVNAHASRFSYSHEEFTGIGPETSRDDRVVYGIRGTRAGLGLRAAATRNLTFGGGVDWQRPELGAGHGTAYPSIETRFDDVTAPGLAGASNFVRPHAFVEFDYRRPLNARRGGLYRVDVGRVVDRDGGRFTFSRVDVDLRQYVSFLAERRILAFRLLASSTRVDAGDEIPFYLLPSLGGNDTLRGFRALRFRGPHRLLLQGEYRWEIWSGLEAALFADAGKVAMRRRDLDLRDLEKDYGFGFRFNTDNGVVVRVDAAFGSRDGRHLHIVFGGVF